MLTEKYRPQSLDDVVGQDQAIEPLKRKIEENKPLPNLIFYGKAGLGKTATAHALANDSRANLVEFNASKTNRVEDMRETIIDSLRYSMGGKRIVLLEEAGQLTPEAQKSFKRPLEKFDTTVIFCTNHYDKLIEPIQSRCKSYEFTKIDTDTIKDRIDIISQVEDIEADIEKIAERSNGDLRQAIVDLDMSEGEEDSSESIEKIKEQIKEYK